MEFRENVDDLMSCVTVSEGMRRAILEGNPEKAGHRAMSRTGAGTEGGMDMGNGRNRKRGHSAWRRAAVPAAAALLVMSTMYVGAGYLMDHTPLRDIFATRDDSALPVPQAQPPGGDTGRSSWTTRCSPSNCWRPPVPDGK